MSIFECFFVCVVVVIVLWFRLCCLLLLFCLLLFLSLSLSTTTLSYLSLTHVPSFLAFSLSLSPPLSPPPPIHRLPATVDNLLVPDYHEADKRMMMKLWDLEQAWKKAKALDDDKLEAARRLKGNDADTASKEDTTAAASEVPPTAAGPRCGVDTIP